jgi:hypothetical protein
MKIIFTTLTFLFISSSLFGQKSPNRFRISNSKNKNYFNARKPNDKFFVKNRLSTGFNYGIHGSISSTNNIDPTSSNVFLLTNRYLFTPNFGVNLKFGWDKFKTKNEIISKTNYVDLSVDLVYDLGDVLDFKAVGYNTEIQKSNFQLYIHGGIGVASMWNGDFASSTATDPYFKNHDDIINLNIGLTPELRINKHFSINVDFSIITNFKQDRAFNYSIENNKDILKLYNTVIGLNYFY